eukprot:COSAG01_NODE_13190_length_1622_cov_1.936310_1_plen_66_part_10
MLAMNQRLSAAFKTHRASTTPRVAAVLCGLLRTRRVLVGGIAQGWQEPRRAHQHTGERAFPHCLRP